jgi:protein TonB
MIRDVNLNSKEWCDLVFEGKNQSYGAYELRRTSPQRHIKALIIVVIVCLLIILLPLVLDKVLPEPQEEAIEETVKMTEVDLNKPKPEQNVQEIEAPPPPELKAAIKFTPPVIDKNASDEETMRTQEEVTKSDKIIFSEDIKGSDSENAVDPNTLVKVEQVTAKPVEVEVLTFAEVMPSYPGGTKELYAFLSKQMIYPPAAAEEGVQGRVVVHFAVGTDGSISQIKVIKPVDPRLDAEAIRLVKLMPKWIPGAQNGKPVSVYYTLPVVFKMQ